MLILVVVFSLLACSPEVAHRPDKHENPGETIRVGDGTTLSRARSGDAVPVARTGGRVSVERAVLSSAGETDLIQARVDLVWPRCSLLEGRDVAAVRQTIVGREPPGAQGFEKSLLDGGIVLWTFHEVPSPDGEAADPRRTPFYVRCVGGPPPDVAHDLTHVVGTSGAAT